jgi:CDP-paratose 2-epimerase
LLEIIKELSGKKPVVHFDDWRPSDQRYYVSDYGKFNAVTGWQPKNSTKEGITKLYQWLKENADLSERKKSKTQLETI